MLPIAIWPLMCVSPWVLNRRTCSTEFIGPASPSVWRSVIGVPAGRVTIELGRFDIETVPVTVVVPCGETGTGLDAVLTTVTSLSDDAALDTLAPDSRNEIMDIASATTTNM